MLESIGYESMDQFIKSVIPSNILEQGKINLGEEKTEEEALAAKGNLGLLLGPIIHLINLRYLKAD